MNEESHVREMELDIHVMHELQLISHKFLDFVNDIFVILPFEKKITETNCEKIMDAIFQYTNFIPKKKVASTILFSQFISCTSLNVIINFITD